MTNPDALINTLAYGSPNRVIDLDKPQIDEIAIDNFPADTATISRGLSVMVSGGKFYSPATASQAIGRLLNTSPGLAIFWSAILFSAAKTPELAEGFVFHLSQTMKSAETFELVTRNIRPKVRANHVVTWKHKARSFQVMRLIEQPEYEYLVSGKISGAIVPFAEQADKASNVKAFLTAAKRGKLPIAEYIALYGGSSEYWEEVVKTQQLEFALDNIVKMATNGLLGKGSLLGTLIMKEFKNLAGVASTTINSYTIVSTMRRYLMGGNPKSEVKWEINPEITAGLAFLAELLPRIEPREFIPQDVDIYVDGSQSGKIRYAYHMSCIESMTVQAMSIAKNNPGCQFYQVGEEIKPLIIRPQDTVRDVLGKFLMKTDQFNHQSVLDNIRQRGRDAILMSDGQFIGRQITPYSDFAFNNEVRLALCNFDDQDLKLDHDPKDYCWVIKGRGPALNSMYEVIFN